MVTGFVEEIITAIVTGFLSLGISLLNCNNTEAQRSGRVAK
jgi:hypothetical protein